MATTSMELLALTLMAKTANYTKGIQEAIEANTRAQQSVKQTQNQFDLLNTTLRRTAAAFGIGLSIRAVTGAIREQIREVGDLQQKAQKLEVGFNFLQGLSLSAELAHVSFENLSIGIQRMQRNIAEAAIGSQRLTRDFHLAGLSAKELATMDTESQLRKVFQSIKNIDDVETRNLVTMELFGRGGMRLLNVIMQGSAGIDNAIKMAKDLGLALGEDDVNAMRAADIAVIKLDNSIKGLARQFATSLAPAITESATALSKFLGGLSTGKASETGGASEFGKDVHGAIKAVAGVFFGDQTPVPEFKAPPKVAKQKGMSEAAEVESEQDKMLQRLIDKFSGELPDGILKTSKAQEILNAVFKEGAKEADISAEKLAELNEQARLGDIKKLAEEIDLETAAMGKSHVEMKILAMERNNLLDASDKQMLMEKDELRVRADAHEKISKIIEKIKEETEAMGLTHGAREALTIANMKGASVDDIQAAKAAARTRDLKEEGLRLVEEGKQITEQFKTPLEKAQEQFDKLRDHFENGRISAQTFSNGVGELAKQFGQLNSNMGVNIGTVKQWMATPLLREQQAGGGSLTGFAAALGRSLPGGLPGAQAVGGSGRKGILKAGRTKAVSFRASKKPSHRIPKTFKAPRGVGRKGYTEGQAERASVGFAEAFGGGTQAAQEGLFNKFLSKMGGIHQPGEVSATKVGKGVKNPFSGEAEDGDLGSDLNHMWRAGLGKIGAAGGAAAAAQAGDFVPNEKGKLSADWALKGNEKFDAIIAELKTLNKTTAEKSGSDVEVAGLTP